MTEPQKKKGEQNRAMTFKLEIYLILAENPSGVPTSKIYRTLEKRFNIRKIRSKKWIRDVLADLKNKSIVQEKPRYGYWKLEETLDAYEHMVREFGGLSAYSYKNGRTIIFPAIIYDSPYGKILKKKYGIEKLSKILSKETPLPKQPLPKKEGIIKPLICIALANNLDGLATPEIVEEVKRFGIKSERKIRQCLSALEKKEIITAERKKYLPTLWKIEYLDGALWRYQDLIGLSAGAELLGDFLKTEYAKKIRERYPEVVFYTYLMPEEE